MSENAYTGTSHLNRLAYIPFSRALNSNEFSSKMFSDWPASNTANRRCGAHLRLGPVRPVTYETNALNAATLPT